MKKEAKKEVVQETTQERSPARASACGLVREVLNRQRIELTAVLAGLAKEAGFDGPVNLDLDTQEWVVTR